MNLSPYPKYKPSGVEWLGEVPAHWVVTRLKTHTENAVNQTNEKADCEPYIALEHVESWTGRIREADSSVQFDSQVKRFRAEDVLFGKLRPYLAKVTRPGVSGVCVSEFLVLRPHGGDLMPNYLEQLLRAKPIIDLITASTFGAKMPRADWEFIGGLKYPLPPLSEQVAIADFLDRETEKIDTLVAKKRTLIERLKEERIALITHTVTRGLPSEVARAAGLEPHPNFKPSGVEWLGDVPTHWEVTRLKTHTENVVDQTNEKADCEPYIALEHVESWTGRIREADSSVQFDSQVKRFRAEDVLFGKLRPYLAKVTRPSVSGVCVGEFLVLRPHGGDLTPNYLEQLLRAKPIIDLITASTFGAKMPRADWKFIGRLEFPLPPLSEQVAIAAFLDRQTEKIDTLVTKIETAIERLQEYRSALITAAVTGKIDVREEADL